KECRSVRLTRRLATLPRNSGLAYRTLKESGRKNASWLISAPSRAAISERHHWCLMVPPATTERSRSDTVCGMVVALGTATPPVPQDWRADTSSVPAPHLLYASPTNPSHRALFTECARSAA